MEYKFNVIGKIQPKQRPRFVRRGAYIQTYTPEATLKYQKLVADSYLIDNLISTTKVILIKPPIKWLALITWEI